MKVLLNGIFVKMSISCLNEEINKKFYIVDDIEQSYNLYQYVWYVCKSYYCE